MQNRYAGDIGDFVKLAILRRLSVGRRLGIAWWLFPDEAHNADGKHVAYLNAAERWRERDHVLFDRLSEIVRSGDRSVAAIEQAKLFDDVVFHSKIVPTHGGSLIRRRDRLSWFEGVQSAICKCDIVFADPDNGLETDKFDAGSAKAGKSISAEELERLRRSGRTLIVYHHQTRRPGGHRLELLYWGRRLSERGFTVDALRASAFSARAFFLLDAPEDMRKAAAEMTHAWGGKLTWHPSLG